MEDDPINLSKNSSDMQFSDLDENNDVTKSRQYNNLLQRTNLIEQSPQDSPERTARHSGHHLQQQQYNSQFVPSHMKNLDQSPQLTLKKNKISL